MRRSSPIRVDCGRRAAEVSRRSLTGGALGVLGAAMTGVLLGPARASAAGKAPKNQAGYRDAPNPDVRCDRCAQFQPPAGCKLVDGAISPSGSCDFFTPKPR